MYLLRTLHGKDTLKTVRPEVAFWKLCWSYYKFVTSMFPVLWRKLILYTHIICNSAITSAPGIWASSYDRFHKDRLGVEYIV